MFPTWQCWRKWNFVKRLSYSRTFHDWCDMLIHGTQDLRSFNSDKRQILWWLLYNAFLSLTYIWVLSEKMTHPCIFVCFSQSFWCHCNSKFSYHVPRKFLRIVTSIVIRLMNDRTNFVQEISHERHFFPYVVIVDLWDLRFFSYWYRKNVSNIHSRRIDELR